MMAVWIALAVGGFVILILALVYALMALVAAILDRASEDDFGEDWP